MKYRNWLLGAAAVFLAAPLSAQNTGLIKGVVTDGTYPLPNASVEIFGRKGAFTTAEDGTFRFGGLGKKPLWIRVRRLGYAPVTFSARVEPGETRNYRVELEMAPYQLSEVDIEGGMTDWRFTDFRWRQASGWGRFYTRGEIAAANSFDLIGLVQRSMPWLNRTLLEQPDWLQFSSPSFLLVSGALSGRNIRQPNCTPGISINGMSPWPGASLADWRLEDVEALEIYRGSHVPLTLQGGQASTSCGLVVVWIR